MECLVEENSMEGLSRPLTKNSKLMILFDFVEHAPGIGLLCHVTRPTLPIHEEDAVAMMKIYIETKRHLAVRWVPDSKSNTSAWHLTSYTSLDSTKETVMRAAKATLLSDDKDAISNKRQEMIKDLSRKQDNRVCRSLFHQFEAISQVQESQSPVPDTQLLSNSVEDLNEITGQHRRSYEDLEQEILESDAKVARLELENRSLIKIIENLKQEVSENEGDPVHQLIKTVQKQTETIQRLLDVEQPQGSAVSLHHLTPQSARSSRLSSIQENSKDTPVKFHGAVNINPTILRSAIIKGRTKTKNSGRRLNATVATLLSAWFTDEELSKMSLAGKACPSIPGSKPKVKFDEEILDAITQFLISKWEKWHCILLTPDAIKSSISDRLLACHTKERKKKLAASAIAVLDDDIPISGVDDTV